MDNKFKKGFILGSVISMVAAIGYAMSDEGQERARNIKENLKPWANKLKMRFSRIQGVSKEEFNELVTDIVEEYARRKEIGRIAKARLINTLKMKWDHMNKDENDENDEGC